jgi:hypothetical protein
MLLAQSSTTKQSFRVRKTCSIQHGVHFDAFGVMSTPLQPRTHVYDASTVSDMLQGSDRLSQGKAAFATGSHVYANPQKRGFPTACVSIVHEGKRPTALYIESTYSGNHTSLKFASRTKLPAAPEPGPRCLPRRWVAVRLLHAACTPSLPAHPHDQIGRFNYLFRAVTCLTQCHMCVEGMETLAARYFGTAPRRLCRRACAFREAEVHTCIRVGQKGVTAATRVEGDSLLLSV